MKRHAATAAAVTVLVIAVAVAVALWRGGNGASSAGPATAPSSPKHSLIASTSALPGPELEDGRHFGYIESIDLETPVGTVVFDLGYFLSGEEANQAAAEDGYPTPVDNDYYIVNDNPRLRTLLVSPDITIRLVDWGYSTGLFSADARRFQQSFALDGYPLGRYKGRFSPYWLTIKGGVVVTIEEQYQP
jgi:hypothetical protein